MSVRAIAKVHVVVEIDAGAWGDGCTLAQVHAQAAKEASNRIHEAREALKRSDMRIVEIRPVMTVVTQEERP